jgi:repressor LexA
MKDCFSQRLKKAMEIRGMKQIELAKKTGIGKSSINHYVSGKYEAKQSALYKLSKALDVNESWLMGYDTEMERSKTLPSQQINDFLYLDSENIVDMTKDMSVYEESIEYSYKSFLKNTANFCIKADSDDLTNFRILEGDIIFGIKQETVDDGDLVLISINDKLSIRKVYKNNDEFILISEKNNSKSYIYNSSKEEKIKIIGKVIAFQSNIF